MPQIVAVGVKRFCIAAYSPICWTSVNPDEVVYPARSSIAPDSAALSATDWLKRLTAYHRPVSTASPVNPINTEPASAAKASVKPRVSRNSRCVPNIEQSLVVIAGLQAGNLALHHP